MLKSYGIFHSLAVVTHGYLVVLLLFDLKYFDAEAKSFTVPIYPYPVYLKAVLAITSVIFWTISAILKDSKRETTLE